MKRKPRTKSTAAEQLSYRTKFPVIRARKLQDQALICHNLDKLQLQEVRLTPP